MNEINTIMKYISIMCSALVALACPMAALADDFKYDDEPTIEVGGGESGTPWEGETPGFDVEIDDDNTTGVQKVEAAGTAVDVKINSATATITIIAQAQTTVALYRIGAPIMSILKVNAGENVFSMPRGIYVIAGRKYML